jgi:hypothetical protein
MAEAAWKNLKVEPDGPVGLGVIRAHPRCWNERPSI